MVVRVEDNETTAPSSLSSTLVLPSIPSSRRRQRARRRSASDAGRTPAPRDALLPTDCHLPRLTEESRDTSHRRALRILHRCRSLDESQSSIRSWLYASDSEEDGPNVDLSHGRIRPLRRQSSVAENIPDEEEFVDDLSDEEEWALRNEISSLRLQQERTAQSLLFLRLEQFRLRHQQMLALPEFVQRHGHHLQEDDESIHEIRAIYTRLSADMLETMAGFSPETLALDRGTLLFGRLLELLEEVGQSMGQISASSTIVGATERQLATLRIRQVDDDTLKRLVAKCSICMKENSIGVKQAAMPCSHWHCHECLVHWLRINNSCPVCRLGLEPDAEEDLESE